MSLLFIQANQLYNIYVHFVNDPSRIASVDDHFMCTVVQYIEKVSNFFRSTMTAMMVIGILNFTMFQSFLI